MPAMNIYSIYKATNKINNKVYIGFDYNWPNRKRTHLYTHRSKNCPNWYFYNALKKYGWDNFEWEVIYQSLNGKHCLNVMENHFICEYRTYIGFPDCRGYNHTLGGEGTLGKFQSEENKKAQSIKISERNKKSNWYNNGKENRFSVEQLGHLGEGWAPGRLNQKPTTDGCNWYNNGVEHLLTRNPPKGWVKGMLPLSEEQFKKRSDEVSRRNKGRKFTDEQKKKISLRQMGKGKRIITPVGEFETGTKAAKHYNISLSTLSGWVKKRPTEFYYEKKVNENN
jgi:group I intron endonuclease